MRAFRYNMYDIIIANEDNNSTHMEQLYIFEVLLSVLISKSFKPVRYNLYVNTFQ